MVARLIASLLIAAASVAPSPPWNGLPTRTRTHSGIPGDPVNVAFEGTRAQVLAAFAAIGWVKADPLSLKNDLRMAEAAVLHTHYFAAPVSNLYLFGRAEDFAVEHELGSIARRDHARFWDAHRSDSATHLELWIGDASRDIAVKVLRRHGLPVGTTHRIDGNLDAERDRIVSALRAAHVALSEVMEPGMGQTNDAVNGGGDHFHTDGKVALIILQ